MEWKEYNVYRFAYQNDISKVWVPDGVKFYCFNKERSLAQFEKDKVDPFFMKDGKTCVKYPNQHWMAVIPYSEEVWKSSQNMHYDICGHKDDFPRIQGFVLKSYNLNDIWIIWDLEQCCPLGENWPETTEFPTIGINYVKHRAKKVYFDTYQILSIVDLLNKNNTLSKEDKQYVESNIFEPITSYIRINGITPNGEFDCTTVECKSWVDGDNICMLKRSQYPITNIIRSGDTHIEQEHCSEDEFIQAYNTYTNALFDCVPLKESLSNASNSMLRGYVYDNDEIQKHAEEIREKIKS